MPCSESLAAFDGSHIDATGLKEQLRRNFRLELTAAEIAAIMDRFAEGDGLINCNAFVNEFYKFGKCDANVASTTQMLQHTNQV
jgi:hypothetical protein